MREILNQKKGLGPWLLTEETLTKIDSLMVKAYEDFVELAESSNKNYTKKLTIWFSNGSKVEFKSFREVLMSESFSNQIPEEFEYVIEVGVNKINIEFHTKWLNYFQYYILCEDKDRENNIIYDMKSIYSAEKPKLFFSVASMLRFLSFAFYILLLYGLNSIYNLHYEIPNNKVIKNKAYQILSKDSLQQEDYFELIKYNTIYNFKLYKLIEDDNSKNISEKYGTIYIYGT